MMGLGASTKVEGERYVNWVFKDDYRVSQEVNAKAYYIPSSSVKLSYSQQYFKHECNESIGLAKDGSTSTFATGKSLIVEYVKGSKLHIAYASIMGSMAQDIYPCLTQKS